MTPLQTFIQKELQHLRERGLKYFFPSTFANMEKVPREEVISILEQMVEAGQIRRAYAYYCPEEHTLAENMKEEPTNLTCDECLLSYSREEMYCKEKYFLGGSK